VPPWEEWLGEYGLAEGPGGLLEYELAREAHASVTDAETQTGVQLGASSVMALHQKDGYTTLCFPDGTRITRGKNKVKIEKLDHPLVTVSETPERVTLLAHCPDGLRVEVTPQRLNARQLMDPCGSSVPSTHAFVALHHPMRYTLRSLGDGEVEILPPEQEGKGFTYAKSGIITANCDRAVVAAFDDSRAVRAFGSAMLGHGGKFDSIDPVLSTKTITLKVADLPTQIGQFAAWLQDAEGGVSVAAAPPAGVECDPEPLLPGDLLTSVGGNPVTVASLANPGCWDGGAAIATVSRTIPEPRALTAGKPYWMVDAELPQAVPEPRMLLVHGDGSAEEHLAPVAARQALVAASLDDQAWMRTQGQDPKGKDGYAAWKGCKVHTCFEAVSSMQPQAGVSALNIPQVLQGLDGPAVDKCALKDTELWRVRTLLEFPELTPEKRAEFNEALEWYAFWDAKERAPKEDTSKKKKKAKPKKAPKKKKGQVEEEPQVKLPTGRNFTQYELEVESLKLRAATRKTPPPGILQIVEDALAWKNQQQPDQTAPLLEQTVDMSFEEPLAPSEYLDEPQHSIGEPVLQTAKRADYPIPDAQIPTFQYFTSEMGLGWLMDSGEFLDRTEVRQKPQVPDLPAPEFYHAWNPPLVDEIEEEPEPQQPQESGEPGFEPPPRHVQAEPEVEPMERPLQPDEEQLEPYVVEPPDPKGLGNLADLQRVEDVDWARPTTPPGPHPDKKSIKYDVYGRHRPVATQKPQAFISTNLDFLQVEAETDRRVRTSSVVLKKNARLAASCSAVRRAGCHTLPGSEHQRGVGAVVDADVAPHDQQMTGSMQGLGNPDRLVEVSPGALRFGLLRQGAVYRMHVFVKNLDVDLQRYTVKPVEPPFLRLWYEQKPLASGMSVKITVEVQAHAPAQIEQFLDVRLKSHQVKVPIFAQVLDWEQYDQLDEESIRLHARRVLKPSVEVLQDDAYMKKVLGANFRPQLETLGESMSLDF